MLQTRQDMPLLAVSLGSDTDDPVTIDGAGGNRAVRVTVNADIFHSITNQDAEAAQTTMLDLIQNVRLKLRADPSWGGAVLAGGRDLKGGWMIEALDGMAGEEPLGVMWWRGTTTGLLLSRP